MTSATRSAALPQFRPRWSGYPTIVATAWTGFFLPPKTPQAVVNRLEQAILQVAAMPDVQEQDLPSRCASSPRAHRRAVPPRAVARQNANLERRAGKGEPRDYRSDFAADIRICAQPKFRATHRTVRNVPLRRLCEQVLGEIRLERRNGILQMTVHARRRCGRWDRVQAELVNVFLQIGADRGNRRDRHPDRYRQRVRRATAEPGYSLSRGVGVISPPISWTRDPLERPSADDAHARHRSADDRRRGRGRRCGIPSCR